MIERYLTALRRLWTRDETALRMERVDKSLASQLADSLKRNSQLVRRNVELALENDRLRKRISELERS